MKKQTLGFIHILVELFNGKSFVRILMDYALTGEKLIGRIVDIGGGKSSEYISYMDQTQAKQITPVDGSLSGIDFEKDLLPFNEGEIDTLLVCNVLEHIYNFNFFTGELYRILKNDGSLIGFVPFWVGYHPDPSDFFRYTEEGLRRILEDAGFSAIEVISVGRGPIIANFNTIVLSVPRIVRPVLYVWYTFFDSIFVSLRPDSKKRQPLGFIFKAKKHV